MGHFGNGYVMKSFEQYRNRTGDRRVEVRKVEVALAPWFVDFYVGAEKVGVGQFHTGDQADSAAANFLFFGVAYGSGS